MILASAQIETKLGTMVALADDTHLYLLQFTHYKHLKREIAQVQKALNATLATKKPAPIISIETEIENYSSGNLSEFKTPYKLIGTEFQKSVWHALEQIPLGKTSSYKDIAHVIGNPKGFRAVALANGANPLAVIVPCHRVINSNGKLGGYSGGIQTKKELLALEGGFFYQK